MTPVVAAVVLIVSMEKVPPLMRALLPQGGREVADFVTFLEKNASTKLKKTEL